MIDRDRRRLFKNKWFNRNKLLQVKWILTSGSQGKSQDKRHSHNTVKCFSLFWWEMCLLSRPFSPPCIPEMLQAGALPFCVKNIFLLRAWWQPTQCEWPEDLEATLQFNWIQLNCTQLYIHFFKEDRKSCNLSDKLWKWKKKSLRFKKTSSCPNPFPNPMTICHHFASFTDQTRPLWGQEVKHCQEKGWIIWVIYSVFSYWDKVANHNFRENLCCCLRFFSSLY